MQRSGTKPWYCRSPETRPRHQNKSLQAQMGLMWCLGLVLTSAEEWVLPAASWRVSLPAGTREMLSTTAGGYLQPRRLLAVTRYSRWSKAHEWHCLRSVWEVTLWTSLCNCKALGTEGKMETRHLFGPSSPHPPATYTTQSNPRIALPAKFRQGLCLPECEVSYTQCGESVTKYIFLFKNTSKVHTNNLFLKCSLSRKQLVKCFTFNCDFQLPLL